MKTHLVWLLGACSAVVAGRTDAQQRVVAETQRDATEAARRLLRERLVSLDMRNASLKAVLDTVSVRARVRILYQSEMIEAYAHPVSVAVTNVSLAQVLEHLLARTMFGVVPLPSGRVAVVERGDMTRAMNGVITGRITDAVTGKPIAGASIALGSEVRGVTTGADGIYKLRVASVGPQTVHVRIVGYLRQERAVTVADGETVTANFGLSTSTNTLDQVVVTGTVIPTELKAVPNAITIITAKQIEERGITKIDQLFRGDVPGLFASNTGGSDQSFLDEVTMFSRGTTSLNQYDLKTYAFTGYSNPIKTYVDGVEMANPKYLSQIDPKSIERIEILTGPQASTIYGSNAINGVMQIFTKRGTTSTPQLTLNLQSGWVQNDFSQAHTPRHDYSAQVSGVGGGISYNAGGSWNYTGPWTPAKQLARTDGFGGARLETATPLGRVTADVTLRRGVTKSIQRGSEEQLMTSGFENGLLFDPYNDSPGLTTPTVRSLNGQTSGVTLSYAPSSWWSHELGVGVDVSDTESLQSGAAYTAPYDTTLSVSQGHTDRRSLRYATTVRVPMTAFAQATVTAGADAWQNLTSSWASSSQTLTGSLRGFTVAARQPDHNAGSFLQTQVGVLDRLFFTYGLRAEWSPEFGAEQQPNYAPRYGVAYTQELNTPLGPVTAKLRGSYGRSTRPPAPGVKAAQTIIEYTDASYFASRIAPYYGGLFNTRLANPALGPEYQQGGEGGLELYVGTRGSLVVTRYNQTVDGLIAQPKVDSVRTLVPCAASFACGLSSSDADGYGYYYQYQYLNIGSIRNQGWELQGNVTAGPLTTHGTYSWTKSRTIGIIPKYRALFVGQSQYQPGGTFRYLPEHTWALGMTYASTSSTVGVTVNGTGRVTNLQNDFFFLHLTSYIRLQQDRWNANPGRQYVYFNPSYEMADLNASHRFAARMEGVLNIQNLMNHYVNDYSGQFPTIGRQTKLGFRLRY